MVSCAGTACQACFRRYIAVKRFKRVRAAAVKVEAIARTALWRLPYKRYIRAVTKLQANFRRLHIRRSHAQVAEGRRRWKGVLDDREAVVLQVCPSLAGLQIRLAVWIACC